MVLNFACSTSLFAKLLDYVPGSLPKENRLAKSEQGQVLSSSEAVIEELARQNKAYYQRHGFIFIVYAKGKSADEMLQILNLRINNATADEFANAAAEHQRITQSRLQDIFDES